MLLSPIYINLFFTESSSEKGLGILNTKCTNVNKIILFNVFCNQEIEAFRHFRHQDSLTFFYKYAMKH